MLVVCAPVRANAEWSLRKLTGRKDEPDVERWRRWYAAETSWWQADAAGAFEALRDGSPFEVGNALRDLSRHRLSRHESAEEILPVLERGEAHLVAQACATLGALGSGLAKPGLREVLEHEDPTPRAAAWEALKAITGRTDLPADPAAWEGI